MGAPNLYLSALIYWCSERNKRHLENDELFFCRYSEGGMIVSIFRDDKLIHWSDGCLGPFMFNASLKSCLRTADGCHTPWVSRLSRVNHLTFQNRLKWKMTLLIIRVTPLWLWHLNVTWVARLLSGELAHL